MNQNMNPDPSQKEVSRIPTARLHKARVEYLPEGGALTYFEDQKYPVHGIPTDEGLWAAEMVKKYMIMASPGIIINEELFSTGGVNKEKFEAKLKELSLSK